MVFIAIFFSISEQSKAEKCYDFQLLNGIDELVDFGLDSTGHWWAVTAPFEGQYNMIIDGGESNDYIDLNQLKFSPDGNSWAYFGETQVGWELVSNDTIIELNATKIGEIVFSPNSEVMAYTYFEGDDEVINIGGKIIRVLNRTGRLYLSWGAEKYAFVGMRNDMYVLNINGSESYMYDEITPVGFWNDGTFLYAARSGNQWEIYYQDEAISEMFESINEVKINLFGTVAVFLARDLVGNAVSVLISDDYYDPQIGASYDWAGGLALHPDTELFAYKAMLNNIYYVVFNNTEYSGGEITGEPMFTHDGSEMYFIGCNVDCFVKVNGTRHPILVEVDAGYPYAKKPGSQTLAYASSSAMVILDLMSRELYSGMMVDATIPPIYNWRNSRYETLGSINNRLYLLTCEF